MEKEEKKVKIKRQPPVIEDREEIIEKYKQLSDWPKWFKGLSIFQINALYSLQYKLRDDLEQATIDRVHLILVLLGLGPMVTNNQLKTIMYYSGGNDLAFLWFLWQLFYLEPNTEHIQYREYYNENEKILLSSISHLDTITTFRALDKILPVQGPKPKPAQIAKNVKKNNNNNKKKKKRLKCGLPYFEKLVRPPPAKERHTVRLKRPLGIKLYAAYKDPHHIVPNEANRWFVDYKVNHTKRICLGILNETVVEVNARRDRSKNKGEEKPSNQKCPEDKVVDIPPCCETHQQMRAAEKSRQTKLCAQKLRGCLKNLNPGENKKEAMRRKVLRDIDREVNAFQEKTLKELNDEYKIRQESLNICKSPVKVNCKKTSNYEEFYEDDEFDYIKNIDVMSWDSEISSASSGENVNHGCLVPVPRLVVNEDDDERLAYFQYEYDYGQVINNENNETKANEGKTGKHVKIFYPDRFGKCENVADRLAKYDYGYPGMLKTEISFFEAPSYHKPYKFLYENIFNIDDTDPYKTGINNALGANTMLEEDKAINNYCKMMWKNEVDAFKQKYKKFEKTCNIAEKNKIKLYQYAREYYDPRDKQLMNNLLYDGLKELRKDKRYVQATLPDAHKIPIVREWVLQRYGLVYSEKELDAQLRESKKLFGALQDRPFDVDFVPFMEFAELSYGCRDYIYARSLEERKKYIKSFRYVVMEPIVPFWTAMLPYSCPGGPPRQTFYAYMPYSPNVVLVFFPWKICEHKYSSISKY